jgi:hypothetical protein
MLMKGILQAQDYFHDFIFLIIGVENNISTISHSGFYIFFKDIDDLLRGNINLSKSSFLFSWFSLATITLSSSTIHFQCTVWWLLISNVISSQLFISYLVLDVILINNFFHVWKFKQFSCQWRRNSLIYVLNSIDFFSKHAANNKF